MERKHHLLIGIALIISIAVAILISSMPPLPAAEGGGVKDCGPNRCPLSSYVRNETSCKCVFIGLGDQRVEWNFPEADPEAGISSASFSMPCNLELSQRNLQIEGINTVRWLSDTLMEVNVIATAQCASGIRSSGVKMEENSIMLWYSLLPPSQDAPLVSCRCGREVVYWIEGLDWHQEYPLTLQELK